ncbi:MAG: hypothetical protein HY331_00570 [Chloroflexi bacterium]|nr:hypothetical protein [Chloroflexota bacterium]
MTFDPRYYLPYLRRWSDGSVSEIAVQNPDPSASPRNVRLDVFDTSGVLVGTRTPSGPLNQNGSWVFTLDSSFPQFVGFGVVRSNTAYLSVMAKLLYPAMASGYTAYKAPIGGNLAIPGSRLPSLSPRVPMLKKAWWGRTSYLYVVNTENAVVQPYIEFKHAQGDTAMFGDDFNYLDPVPLNPGQGRTYDLHAIGLPVNPAGRWLGSARITALRNAGDPIGLTNNVLGVVASDTADDHTQDEMVNAFALEQTSTQANIPLVKNVYGWVQGSTGIAVMNVDPNYSANVTLTFYECYRDAQGFTNCSSSYEQPAVTIDPLRSYFWYQPNGLPSGFLGSARAVSNNGVPIVAISEEAYTYARAIEGRPAFLATTTNATELSLATKDQLDQCCLWTSGIQVQNVGSTTITDLSVWYYGQGGNLQYGPFGLSNAYPPGVGSLLPGRSVNFYNPQGLGPFNGSVRVRANGPGDAIVATSNQSATNGPSSSDLSLGFNAYPRSE